MKPSKFTLDCSPPLPPQTDPDPIIIGIVVECTHARTHARTHTHTRAHSAEFLYLAQMLEPRRLVDAREEVVVAIRTADAIPARACVRACVRAGVLTCGRGCVCVRVRVGAYIALSDLRITWMLAMPMKRSSQLSYLRTIRRVRRTWYAPVRLGNTAGPAQPRARPPHAHPTQAPRSANAPVRRANPRPRPLPSTR
jgi:hypothetical protein